jgi:hypothetical protein
MSDHASRQWIREALSSLPGKTRNKNLVGNLRKFAEMSERSKEALSLALDGATRVKIVFPSAPMTGLTDRVSNAKKKARACLKDVRQSIDAVSKRTFDERMIDVKDHASSSLKPVLEAWQGLLDDSVSPYEKLAQIVRERQLTGGEALTNSLISVRTARLQTPLSEVEALAIKALINNMPEVLRSLGLSETVGTFLVAVAEGTGSVRALEIGEIREFLDRYGMWEALRVSFGGSR